MRLEAPTRYREDNCPSGSRRPLLASGSTRLGAAASRRGGRGRLVHTSLIGRPGLLSGLPYTHLDKGDESNRRRGTQETGRRLEGAMWSSICSSSRSTLRVGEQAEPDEAQRRYHRKANQLAVPTVDTQAPSLRRPVWVPERLHLYPEAGVLGYSSCLAGLALRVLPVWIPCL